MSIAIIVAIPVVIVVLGVLLYAHDAHSWTKVLISDTEILARKMQDVQTDVLVLRSRIAALESKEPK